MDVKKLLGENIKKYRKSLNLSQEELAEKLNISPKHLSNIERGRKFASAELIGKIALELGISVSSLFFDEKKLKNEDKIKKIKKVIDKELSKTKKELLKKIVEL